MVPAVATAVAAADAMGADGGAAHCNQMRFYVSKHFPKIHKSIANFYFVHLIQATNKNLEFLQQIFVYLLC